MINPSNEMVVSFSEENSSSYRHIPEHVLTMPYARLVELMGGSGKAKSVWQMLRKGIDPSELQMNVEHQNALSSKARKTLLSVLSNKAMIPAAIINESKSKCGTNKLLLALEDNQKIESVLIPSHKYDRTTLCISTQIGCDRGCAFCMTGTMGLIRNLTSYEIVAQVIQGIKVSLRDNMPPLTNIVLMGMGDAGRNLDAVDAAVRALSDRDRLSMAFNKITISTVGPSPEAFMKLASIPGTLAWSLHSPDDIIRKKLVPSTRHSTVQLRDGLLEALKTRPLIRHRTIMIALTLIDGVNDSEEDARKLALFVRPMISVAPKIALDLIPYNDINVHSFQRPSTDKVNYFQQILREEGFFCSVRVTRGDEENSACGMLATKREKVMR
eukprot:gene13807-18519_t